MNYKDIASVLSEDFCSRRPTSKSENVITKLIDDTTYYASPIYEQNVVTCILESFLTRTDFPTVTDTMAASVVKRILLDKYNDLVREKEEKVNDEKAEIRSLSEDLADSILSESHKTVEKLASNTTVCQDYETPSIKVDYKYYTPEIGRQKLQAFREGKTMDLRQIEKENVKNFNEKMQFYEFKTQDAVSIPENFSYDEMLSGASVDITSGETLKRNLSQEDIAVEEEREAKQKRENDRILREIFAEKNRCAHNPYTRRKSIKRTPMKDTNIRDGWDSKW